MIAETDFTKTTAEVLELYRRRDVIEKGFDDLKNGVDMKRLHCHNNETKEDLIPTLHLGDIVVMDNLRTHHIKAVGELLRCAGVEMLYLPPYSSDLNSIEKLWSKVKAILRKLRVRTLDALEPAIRATVACVSCNDCAAWFRCTGYCLF